MCTPARHHLILCLIFRTCILLDQVAIVVIIAAIFNTCRCVTSLGSLCGCSIATHFARRWENHLSPALILNIVSLSHIFVLTLIRGRRHQLAVYFPGKLKVFNSHFWGEFTRFFNRLDQVRSRRIWRRHFHFWHLRCFSNSWQQILILVILMLFCCGCLQEQLLGTVIV